MLFNSFIFLFVFLPVVFVGTRLLAKIDWRLCAGWLALASLVFYGYWNPKFVLLLLLSATFNYFAGMLIAVAEGKRRPLLLAISIGINLGVLAYYKYANFFLENVAQVAGGHWAGVNIVLPLGISFFTFTQIAFLVDVHRRIATEYNYVHYLLFVTFFPHLIAGPVLHHKDMVPQFQKPETYRIDWTNIAIGLAFFTAGLAKKVLIADRIAPAASVVFDAARDGTAVQFFDAWSGALAYTFQIYFDFSGYSDMAIGLAFLFNIRFPINFNSPYQARTIIDFWRRWHITLSNFLRDYLYIPLGGNRRGPARRYTNLMLTMLLGGLWHGANWTFVIWGGLHGIFLVINYAWLSFKKRLGLFQTGPSHIRNGIALTITLLCVIFAWVFFRAETLPAAIAMLKGMAGLNGISVSPSVAKFALFDGWKLDSNGFFHHVATLGSVFRNFGRPLIIAFVIALLLPNIQTLVQQFLDSRSEKRAAPRSRWAKFAGSAASARMIALGIGLLLGYTIADIDLNSPFLYFQF